MRLLKKLLFGTWTVALVCFLIFCLFVFNLAPLIAFDDYHPWATRRAQWLTVLVVAALWLVYRAAKYLQKRFAQGRLLKGMGEAKPEIAQDSSRQEIQTLENRFNEALAKLSSSSRKIGRRFNLYELPWYIIIGPPGSGKTTALQNSGLKFPLADDAQPHAVQGIGGTRYCDWWFTDQAVLIDTAGRYTTQDSQFEHDRKSWLGFLRLLKKFRSRQPINGAIVAISITDLLQKSPLELDTDKQKISARLQELRDELAVDFPVYFMFTKMDLLAGFDEFFDELGEADRQQIWGMAAESSAPYEVSGDAIRRGFDDLVLRLNTILMARVGRQASAERARKILAFPKQLESIEPAVSEFLRSTFEPSRYRHRLNLRGVFFTSGTQEGTPIDRLMNRLEPSGQGRSSRAGKSYFITRMLTDRVFAERGLAGLNVKLEKRLAILSTGVVAVLVLGTVALLATWTSAYFQNRETIAAVDARLLQVEQQVQDLSPEDADPLAVLPILNDLSDTSLLLREQASSLDWGLGQAEKIQQQLERAYARMLNKGLLARLMVESEQRMQERLAAPVVPASLNAVDSYLYAALRNYLMLGSNEHYNGDEVYAFYQYDWLRRRERELNVEQRQLLNQHLQRLFAARPVPLPITPDETLIAEVRERLRPTPVEQLVLGRIEQLQFENLEPFTVYEKAGRQQADRVFARRSGVSLTEGVRPLYTKAAYEQLAGGQFDQIVQEVLGERWIFGEVEDRKVDFATVKDRAWASYLSSYASEYEQLLADLELKNFSNYVDGAQTLAILGEQDSPLQQLLVSIERETRLTVDNSAASKVADAALQRAQNRLQRILGSAAELPEPDLSVPKDPVTLRFQALHELVQAPQASSVQPSQRVLEQFSALSRVMAEMSLAASGDFLQPEAAEASKSAVLATKLFANHQPELLVRPLLNAAAHRVSSLASGGVIAFVNQRWDAEAKVFCNSAIAGRYPIDKGAAQDVALADFEEFFGYGGILDRFFKSHLAEYVNTNGSPWRVHERSQDTVSLSATGLRAFENADRIRRAFFRPGSKKIAVQFKLQPVQVDAGARGFAVAIDGQESLYEFGQLLAEPFAWPGPTPGSGALVEFRLINGEQLTSAHKGEWAWFKILDEHAMHRNSRTGEYQLLFQIAGFEAEYRLLPDTAFNPFSIIEHVDFVCPDQI